jgi:preprotein translocase SecE subunit
MKEFWQKVVGIFRSTVEFIKETWPARRELTGTTMVVIVAVFFFGFFLYVVDRIIGFGITYLYRLAGQ